MTGRYLGIIGKIFGEFLSIIGKFSSIIDAGLKVSQ